MNQASPKIGIANDGTLVVKNRAWRRKWKSRAEVEGRKKNFYTTKKLKEKGKNGTKSKKSKGFSK